MKPTKRVHGGAALEKQVRALYNEGWHVENIASISGASLGVVRDILNRQKLIID